MYKIKINFEDEIEANSEVEAVEKFYSNMVQDNETPTTFLDNIIEVEELCPHCKVELENKMIDTDGTNLSEHKICPKCGYGTPALN